jgi:osmoprotectant transport system substrate-binding protein
VGRPGAGKPVVTLGDKNFSEEFLLGALYAQALEAKGFTVRLRSNIGTSAATDRALTSHQIDLYPEYTGVIYTVLAGHKDNPRSAEQTLAGASAYESGRGYAVLNPTPFQDADGLAVSQVYANKYGLRTIADLSRVGRFRYGGPPENGTRYQGVVGLRQAYGLERADFVPLRIGSQYDALDKGTVDSIAVFTTDGQLASGKYTVLTDTLGIFGFQQVVPVVSKKVLSAEGPAFSATLNAVSRVLTTDAVVKMNQAVQIQKQAPAAVARQFLLARKMI